MKRPAGELRRKLLQKAFHTKLPFYRMRNVFETHIDKFEKEIREDEKCKLTLSKNTNDGLD